MNVKKRKRMLYFALREGPKPSQIESSNLGIVLLQVIGSWLRAKLGGQSHEEAAKADHMGGRLGLFYNEVLFYLLHGLKVLMLGLKIKLPQWLLIAPTVGPSVIL